MSALTKVMIMAGGTGGHVFPGLAVAKAMREKNIDVHWLGTSNSFEEKTATTAGFSFHPISIQGVRGKKLQRKLMAPFHVMIAIVQSISLLRRIKPQVVLGMGGFASGPGGIAAWLLGIPLVIHEQNAKPGLTNRWLARVAKKVLTGFPNTFTTLKSSTCVGNPVRKEMTQLPIPQERFKQLHEPFRLLVLGGSLGAQALNALVPQALAQLPEQLRPIVYHQTGEKHLNETLQHYAENHVSGKVVPFIQDMDKAYEWADLAICRAGALTIAELCAVGLGAILVPFPFAVDDHQTTNGEYLEKAGAALLIQQKELTVDRLVTLLQHKIIERSQCLQMANVAYQLRRIDSVEKIMMMCEEVVQ